MKKIMLFIGFTALAFRVYSQAAVVVVRSPQWAVEDAAKASAEKADRAAQYIQMSEVVVHAQEQLAIVKEATRKLIQINRRVADYRHLEEAIVQVGRAYGRVRDLMNTLNQHNCFSPSEYRQINESLIALVGQTSDAITSLTVVLTDNFSSMTDGERLLNMNMALKDLHENLCVVDDAIIQIEYLDYQRMQLRTIKYLNSIFK